MDISVEDLVNSIDIVEYISQYVPLVKCRNGEYVGSSPFTKDDTPSFTVNSRDQLYFDFSSSDMGSYKRGGNVYNFVQAYFRCSGREAYKKLLEYIGNGSIQTSHHSQFFRIARHYQNREAQVIPENKPYKILNEDLDFDISKLQIWIDEGITIESLKKFGVMYDRWSKRIVYPIVNEKGVLVNYGARTLDPEYKAKKIPKYIYMTSWGDGGMNVIYGLYENMNAVMESGEIILFEGCKSVMLANSWGIYNSCAILTSHLGKNQLKKLISLSKFGVKVVFALDKGIDPVKDRNIQILKRYMPVEIIYDYNDLLEDKMAPVDNGREIFDRLYKSRFSLR